MGVRAGVRVGVRRRYAVYGYVPLTDQPFVCHGDGDQGDSPEPISSGDAA